RCAAPKCCRSCLDRFTGCLPGYTPDSRRLGPTPKSAESGQQKTRCSRSIVVAASPVAYDLLAPYGDGPGCRPPHVSDGAISLQGYCGKMVFDCGLGGFREVHSFRTSRICDDLGLHGGRADSDDTSGSVAVEPVCFERRRKRRAEADRWIPRL